MYFPLPYRKPTITKHHILITSSLISLIHYTHILGELSSCSSIRHQSYQSRDMNREKEFPGASIIPTFRTTTQQMYLSFSLLSATKKPINWRFKRTKYRQPNCVCCEHEITASLSKHVYQQRVVYLLWVLNHLIFELMESVSLVKSLQIIFHLDLLYTQQKRPAEGSLLAYIHWK